MDQNTIIYQGGRALRRGWTTGTCAAAAAQAAAQLLLTGVAPPAVRLTTPAGVTFTLLVEEAHRGTDAAVCAVRKKAGDDPDVTDGIRIFASVRRTEKGIVIRGGAGIGVVTMPGLSVPVGEPAINPGPQRQITDAVMQVCRAAAYAGGLMITLSAEHGEEIAQQTYNAHLGIVGGISILGTSGVVEPMSEKALTDTIRLELDCCYAQGQRIAFLCPGNYGADFARNALGLALEKAVKCSNYVGEALDHAACRGFTEILLIGHAGKLVKIAAGVMNTHSSIADGRQEVFTAYAALCGAGRELLEALMQAISVDACVALLDRAGLRRPVLDRIGAAVSKRLEQRLRGKAQAEFIMFTGQYGVLAQSPGAWKLCESLKESI